MPTKSGELLFTIPISMLWSIQQNRRKAGQRGALSHVSSAAAAFSKSFQARRRKAEQPQRYCALAASSEDSVCVWRKGDSD